MKLEDNIIIICENEYKDYYLRLLDEDNKLLNIKFYSKKEFMNKYFFAYDEHTLYYLINKYNYNIDVALMYLNNLYYIEDKEYKSHKLNLLKNIKKDLNDNNLLIYDNEFKKQISNKKIYVVGYDYLTNYELKVFNSLNTIIYKDSKKDKELSYYTFDNINDEVEYVANSISSLLTNNIDINNIKITGITDEYIPIINRVFKLYNIPIKLPSHTLISSSITNRFISNLSSDLNDAINSINNEDESIVNKIINICNKYVFIDNIDIRNKLIIHDLKRSNINDFNLKNYVEITNLNYPFTNKNYVYVMNFCEGIYPRTIKDEDYITDNIKEEINELKTNEIFNIVKSYYANKLYNIDNLVITYKKHDTEKECFKSIFIDELNMKESIISNDNIRYSIPYDLLKYASFMDEYNKYGVLNNKALIIKNSINTDDYLTYDNKYSGIDKQDLQEYLTKGLTLSYSSISNYNKCSFRYYLSNILKIDSYKENFEAFIGSIFHDVLEKCIATNEDVDKTIDDYIQNKNKQLTIKEEYFINKIRDDIKYTLNIIRNQNRIIGLDKALYEQNITIDINNNVRFTGFIDKLLYKEDNNNTYIAIVDYKTGNVDIDLKYVPFGVNLQLPVYLYLVKNSKLFRNPLFTGFYIQYILDKEVVLPSSNSYDEERFNRLKLVGYSNKDVNILSEFDKTYSNSDLIKSLRMTKNGTFYGYSKVLDNDQIDLIVSKTNDVINKNAQDIMDAKFDINPKSFSYKNIGCKYCKFYDICYKKSSDEVIIPDSEVIDFLGGDVDEAN